jgi:hypothetical protein
LADETAVLRSRVRDADAIERATPSAMRVLRSLSAEGPAAGLLGAFEPSDRAFPFSGLDRPAHELTLAPRRGKGSGLAALWTIRAGELVAVASRQPRSVFSALLATPAPPTLAQQPELVAMLGRRMQASLCVLADLTPRASAALRAPLVLAAGRREKAARAELELSAPAVAGLLSGWLGQ